VSKQLIYKLFTLVISIGFAALSGADPRQAEGAVGEGESSIDSESPPLQPLNLTLRGALAAAVENNPDVPNSPAVQAAVEEP
jgi:hypothetical protein